MARKLSKKIEGTIITLSVLDSEELSFDTSTLPDEIQSRLVPFGAGHKLGDSAASAKTPEEAVAAIKKVWEGMMENKWTVRVPGEPGEKAPKLTKSAILANLEKLPPEQQEAAKLLLASMGIKL